MTSHVPTFSGIDPTYSLPDNVALITLQVHEASSLCKTGLCLVSLLFSLNKRTKKRKSLLGNFYLNGQVHNRTTNSCIHASWFSFISSSFFFTFKVSLSWTMQELDDGKVLLRLAHLYEVLFPFLLHSIVARSIISELSLYEVNLFFGISNFYLCYVWFYKSTTGKEKIVRK